MEKYSDQLKSDLNRAIGNMLSKKETIKVAADYNLVVGRMGTVSVTNISELRLMDFIGGRKFEAAGEGKFSIAEKVNDDQVLRHIAFSIRKTSVNYNDVTKQFDVVDIGEFTALDFVSN